ncbi:MAG: aspartyl protease family protein [Planctomycetales bacterium]|nr:aspartyl protease family protein [Planctomycetales bacterium]
MLSASPIGDRPYFDLGPSDGVAWDQPRVTMQLIDEAENIIGPTTFNEWLLDTGANTILGFQTAVGDMTGPPAYQTEGQFEELGVGGTSLYDISKSYRFDFAGESGIRNTLPDTRIITDATRDVSIFGPYGIVGMPAMTQRVTTLDFTPWTTIEGLDLFMKVDFSNDVPAYAGPRYTVAVDNRFEYFPEPHVIPLGGPPPAWADIPFLSAQLLHNGQTSSGNFLFDTGAQVSILNRRMAFELGLDTNNDGELDSKDASYARNETISGISGSTSVPVFLIDEVHVPTEEGPDLVWTDLQWLVLDIDPGIDAVFGFDNMTSGWIEAFAKDGKSGYIMQSHLDFRNYETTGQGKIYFDINPEISAVVDPNGPGAAIDESGGLTSVSETGVTDTYTLRLTTAPTADVRVTLDSPDDQQATAVDANHPSHNYLDFTPLNWSIPQTVLVSAIDDSTPESFHRTFVRHTSTSSDPAYQAVGMPRVVINITDNDYPGVMLIPSDGATEVTEGGATDTYQVVLTFPPTQPVTIAMANVQNQVTATALVGGGNSLVFTPENWDVPQTVLVTAVDDAFSEGTLKTYISHSLTTEDTDFQQAFILQEVVTINDNDVADTTPPRVLDVQVGSSSWNAPFIDAVDGGGIANGNGRGLSLAGPEQLKNLPWINIDRIYIQFSEDVADSLSPAKIALAGTNIANYMPGLTLAYGEDGINVATLRFASPIANDSLILSLLDTITDAAGNPLDGEWSDASSTSSGDGTAGGRFDFRIDVLPGDVNNNGGVNTADLYDDYDMVGTVVKNISHAYYDVNGNGGVNTADLYDAYNWIGRILPSPPARSATASLANVSLANEVSRTKPAVNPSDLPVLLGGLGTETRLRTARTLPHNRVTSATEPESKTLDGDGLLGSAAPQIVPTSVTPPGKSWRDLVENFWERADYDGLMVASQLAIQTPMIAPPIVVPSRPEGIARNRRARDESEERDSAAEEPFQFIVPYFPTGFDRRS